MEEDKTITWDDLRKATKEAVQYVHDLQAELALISPELEEAKFLDKIFPHYIRIK